MANLAGWILAYCIVGVLSLVFFLHMPWFLGGWDYLKIFLLWPLVWYGYFRGG